jgi:hypothetical protein
VSISHLVLKAENASSVQTAQAAANVSFHHATAMAIKTADAISPANPVNPVSNSIVATTITANPLFQASAVNVVMAKKKLSAASLANRGLNMTVVQKAAVAARKAAREHSQPLAAAKAAHARIAARIAGN